MCDTCGILHKLAYISNLSITLHTNQYIYQFHVRINENKKNKIQHAKTNSLTLFKQSLQNNCKLKTCRFHSYNNFFVKLWVIFQIYVTTILNHDYMYIITQKYLSLTLNSLPLIHSYDIKHNKIITNMQHFGNISKL